jgi:hypothetical protein
MFMILGDNSALNLHIHYVNKSLNMHRPKAFVNAFRELTNNHFALPYEHNEQSMGAYNTIVP